MDVLRPRRRLLYRRLWRCRRRVNAASGKKKMNDEDAEEVRQQKALVRLLTRTIGTTQLETLARVVQHGTYLLSELVIPLSRLVTVGDRSFAVAGPRLWNTCPGPRTLHLGRLYTSVSTKTEDAFVSAVLGHYQRVHN